jgi:hypothetical protein
MGSKSGGRVYVPGTPSPPNPVPGLKTGDLDKLERSLSEREPEVWCADLRYVLFAISCPVPEAKECQSIWRALFQPWD